MNERAIAADETPALDRPLAGLIRAGITTGIVDGLFSSVLSVFFYGSTVARLFQGVAATLLGNQALDGGIRTEAIGVAMHFGVAFGWSTVFVLLAVKLPRLRRAIATWPGAVKVAAVYGPAIWTVMSLVVIPLLVRRPPAITFRWWVQLVGHVPFVGLPIVGSVKRTSLG
jgi:hypothetical protein